MNKTWWIILILLMLGGLWYGFAHKPSPVQYVKMLSEKGSYAVETQKVKYYEQVEGFLAKPTKVGVYPGVVIIHDSWGLNDNIRDLAKLLSSFGYSVLAVDLYNSTIAKTAEEAQKQIGSLDQEKAILNMKSAVDYLRKNENAEKIASLGWGFGGGQSLKLSLSGEKLNATVIYYGDLLLEQRKLIPIKWPVFGVFGDRDTIVPVDAVRIFDTVLTGLNTPHEIQIYPGVGHAFTNPSDANYAPKEALDAWKKTVRFLEENLKK